MTADAIVGATPKPVPTWAVITVLSLAGTTVSLQQTMVIPLLPGFQHLLQSSRSSGCPRASESPSVSPYCSWSRSQR
jgi:hypothetical protein